MPSAATVELTPRDRRLVLLTSTTMNGIDFVEPSKGKAFELIVHFLNSVALVPAPTADMLTITGGDRIPEVSVVSCVAAIDRDGRPTLVLRVRNPADLHFDQAPPGDFSTYVLSIAKLSTLDAQFSSVGFSFHESCPSDFDCAPADVECPTSDTPLPPIDYTVKDFQSIRRALTEFSATAYPGWQERSEADFGMMFAEVLAQVGDELSYLQDRVAAESSLENATQRRSLVSLARLVDYEPTPALSASTIMSCSVSGGVTELPAGLRISARSPDASSIPFELGTSIGDTTRYAVSARWNFGSLLPYWWDDAQRCLPRGSTQIWLQGHDLGLRVDDPNTGDIGTALLIQTDFPGETLREIVNVVATVEELDPLFPDATGLSAHITRVQFRAEQALQYDHDLTCTRLGGNLVPATQGERYSESFAVGQAPPAEPGLPLAIARRGPNDSAQRQVFVCRWPLRRGPLAWLRDTAGTSAPEIIVTQRTPATRAWTFRSSLLRAGQGESAYTLDPVAWRAVLRDDAGHPVAFDIDGDEGSTLRFGDGVFGLQPAFESVFDVRYRVGAGASGNVTSDAITFVDPSAAALVTSARNPFGVTSGSDQESADQIRRAAPYAFRATQFRAVRPEDYEAAAETLPWVLQAGTVMRWTGSWHSVFTAVDPVGAKPSTTAQRSELVELLNRRRLAGYESYAPEPKRASIDLQVAICAQAGWLAGDVERAVLDRLGTSLATGARGFFFSDHFTFGTPLYRSRLESAIQEVPGVQGVLRIGYRLRGTNADFLDLPLALSIGASQILQIDNDPSFPERGSIRILVEGGR